MTLLPNEREIPLSVSAITLTTHRLRLVSSQRGPFRIVSMMLDELASCAAVKREVPLLLALAAVIAGLGIAMSIFGQNVGPTAAMVGLLVGGLIAILYFATRHTVLVFASGGGSRIEISTGHMDPGMIVELIDTIEQAKDQRARSLVSGTAKETPAARNGGPSNLPRERSAPARPGPAVSHAAAGRGIAHYFYLDLDGQVAGPVTAGELKRLVQDSIIGADTQICAEGGEQWHPLGAAVML